MPNSPIHTPNLDYSLYSVMQDLDLAIGKKL